MKFAYVTFLDAIPSPKTSNTNTTYGHDPASFNGGYDLEERDGWIHVRWPATGVTEVVHPSRVRNARIFVEKGEKPSVAKAGPFEAAVTRR